MHTVYKTTIKKEHRKSISLQCHIKDQNFILSVKAPKYITNKAINDFINKKQHWIDNQFNNFNTHKHMIFPSSFSTGTPLYFLGKRYTIDCQVHCKKSVFFNENTIVVTYPEKTTEEEKKIIITQWYKKLARDILTDRTLHYASKLNKPVNKITLKQQKTRWGSCSTLGNVNLNWLLIKTPLFVINYVTLHECCHLVHMNHSKAFWNLVENNMPTYKEAKYWLKTHGNAILSNH